MLSVNPPLLPPLKMLRDEIVAPSLDARGRTLLLEYCKALDYIEHRFFTNYKNDRIVFKWYLWFCFLFGLTQTG